jgi:hypothetical protein
MVILSYALCFSIGVCIGFVMADFFVNASDKEVRP